MTPLHVVASRNAREVAELLLAKGAKLHAQDKDGMTPLDLAVRGGHGALASMLRTEGAKKQQKSQVSFERDLAIMKSRLLCIRLILILCFIFSWVGTASADKIHEAVKANDIGKVKSLLAKGTNVNAKDNTMFGFTPLHLAVFHNARNMAELLLANGADVNAKTPGGQTPLSMAIKNSNPAIAYLLRKYGAKK